MSSDRKRQQKLQRKAKKAAKRRDDERRSAVATRLSPGLVRGLEEADDLLADGCDDEAIEVLQELERRHPRQVEIVARLAEAYFDLNRPWPYQAVCARLAVIHPKAPETWLALAAAALNNQQYSVAEHAFAHLATVWPDHPESAEARKMQESLRTILHDEMRIRGLDEETGSRVLLMHDEVNLHLHLGQLEKVCESATRLLALCPTFTPALNNRSEAHFRSARFAEAIADSRRVLELEPANFHALANLPRYLYLSGRFAEVEAAAAALKASTSEAQDSYLKKAETFAILGDWEAVRKAVDDGRTKWAKSGGVSGLAEHLAGVALAHLGDDAAAAACWRRAARNGIEMAEENLADSRLPIGQRHGPWAYRLEHWIPRGALVGFTEGAGGSRRSDGVAKLVRKNLERFPQIELLADAVFERSDRRACDTLIQLATLVKRPALFEAVKKFALGRRGSDELRMQALFALSKAEYVDGRVDVWKEGKLNPLELITQEILREPTGRLPPEINELFSKGYEAINDGRDAEAERLFDECLRICPDQPTVKFNRAMAIRAQGREAESTEIVRAIHRDHPDYLFARTHLADVCLHHNDFEQAKTLLAPIAKLKRLHITEYAAWCMANVSLALAMGEPDRASSLLDAWAGMDPGDHRIEILRARIRSSTGTRSFLARLFGRKSSEP